MLKLKILVGIFVIMLSALPLVSIYGNSQMTLAEKDGKAYLMGYRYRVTEYSAAWNKSKSSYETKIDIYYARHWELLETKKYTSNEQNTHFGAYLIEKNLFLEIPDKIYFDDKGEMQRPRFIMDYTGDGFQYVITIVDLEDKRIVWWSYDWESF